MINEFSVKPKPKNNNAKIVTVIALGLGALTIIVSMLIPKFRGVVGTVGVCFLVTAILLYTKFVTPVYYYDVVLDNNGLPLLVVRQVVGKRATTLCRVDVYAIRKMESQTGKESRAHKTPAGMKKYVYTPTLFPPSVYRLTVISEYENAEIVIEVTDELAGLLWQYAEEARAMMVQDQSIDSTGSEEV